MYLTSLKIQKKMTNTKTKNTTTLLLGLTLTFALVLNSLHVKDVFVGKSSNADDGQVKIVADLHNHVDKKVGQTTSSDMLVDSRSLRLNRFFNKKDWSIKGKLPTEFLNSLMTVAKSGINSLSALL